MFSLIDLMKDPYPGKYYGEQLTKTEKPDYKKTFFEVEKVLQTKVYNKKKYFLVKFLYYPNKFNEYISEDNFKGNVTV